MPIKIDKEKQNRKNVTFSKMQIELIQLGVELGMALSESDYIRKAVDKLNEEIPIYQKIKEYIDKDDELEKKPAEIQEIVDK